MCMHIPYSQIYVFVKARMNSIQLSILTRKGRLFSETGIKLTEIQPLFLLVSPAERSLWKAEPSL